MTEKEIANYYAKRASEYENIYLKPERQSDLEQLQKTISEAFRGLDLLEIACGTGYWTQFASRSAKSIVAVDYNEEVLAVARKKDYGSCPIMFLKGDVYVLGEVDGTFSAALLGFWWSHVLKANLDGFLQVLHSKLSEGATVIILDNRYIEGSSTPISRSDGYGNTYQTRRLTNGSTYEVLKNFPTQEEFIKRVALFAQNIDFIELDYFWLAQYRSRGSVEHHNALDQL